MLGNNLPQPSEVIKLYQSKGVKAMRIYSPNADVLNSLRGTGIELIIGVANDDLQSIGGNQSAATAWVNTHIQTYHAAGVSFRYIAVGNEVTGESMGYILPAMQNIYNALSSVSLQDKIKVSTAVSRVVLKPSPPPPSMTAFSPEAEPYMIQIVQFLAIHGAPLLADVYPYFTYIDTPYMDINYALFTSPETVLTDGNYEYQNLFDAVIDGFYAAIDGVGGKKVDIVVSETGWPSYGGKAATLGNAQTYNQNLINHIHAGRGTPRRSGKAIEAYIYAMFDENQKQTGNIIVEKHFGLFYPNKQHVYPIDFL